jgi:hypothetical protein
MHYPRSGLTSISRYLRRETDMLYGEVESDGESDEP